VNPFHRLADDFQTRAPCGAQYNQFHSAYPTPSANGIDCSSVR
jgi:hypothetical protein